MTKYIKVLALMLGVACLSSCSYGPRVSTPGLADGSFKQTLSRMQPSLGSNPNNKNYQLDRDRMIIHSSENKAIKKRQYNPKLNCSESEKTLDISKANLITLNLIESDLREALVEISMMTEIPIVMDETVEGIVTSNIVEQPLSVALKMILSTGNFAHKIKEEYILVGSARPDNPTIYELSETCVYKPENMKPLEIVELLSPYYRQYVTYSKTSRHLTITAPQNIAKRLERDILKLDFPPEQVLLEVNIVEVSSNALRIMGIDWGQLMFIDNRRINATNIGITNVGIDQTVEVSSMMNNIANPYITFLSAVKFLSDKGMAVMKGMPSIITMDGHKANFNSTQTIWFTPNATNTANNSNVRALELTYGIDLEIIPRLAHNHMVKLDIIKAGVSDLTQSSRGTSPKLISHKISNTIRVGSGETLVMGGLLQKKNFLKNSKVPGLGDIPVAELMFKQNGSGSYTTEVLIVITPRILESNEEVS